MATKSNPVRALPTKSPGASEQELSDNLLQRLTEKFPGAVKANVAFGKSYADLVLERPEGVIVAEVKTGDPELPLPSSTVAQMDFFVQHAKTAYPGCKIIPVVLTNYGVSESDKQVLDREGVKVVSVGSGSLDSILENLLKQV